MYRPSIARIGCRILGYHTRQHGQHYFLRIPAECQVKLGPVIISPTYYSTKITTKENKVIDIAELLPQDPKIHNVLNLFDPEDAANSSIITLEALGKISDQNRKIALSDPKFHEMVNWLAKHSNKLSPPDVIRSLKHLFVLYPDHDPEIITTLEECFQSFGNRMSVNHLYEYVQSHQGQNASSRRNEAYNRAKDHLFLRWAEVGEPSLLIDMLYQADEKSMKNLEIKAMELSPKMTASHIYKLLRSLDHYKRHNAPLIRALVYHLNLTWSESKWTFSRLVKLAQVCANLNIYNETLFTNWSSIISEYAVHSDQLLMSKVSTCSCIRSIGSFRWHDKSLIDNILGLLLQQEKTTVRDLNEVLAMCAAVNYMPQQLQETLPKLCENLSSDYIVADPRSYLEIVWNLCVLGALEDSRISPEIVLSETFTNALKGTFKAQVYAAICVKLMHINTTIKLEMPGHENLLLPDDFLAQNDVQVPIRKQRPLVKVVTAALSEIYPQKKFFKQDVQSPLGYTIDIEMLVNSEGIPCPLTSDQTNLTRLAVKVLDFPDMTLNEYGPVGRFCMMERHLAKDGYKVIMIPYKEIADLDTTVKYVRYLEAKLQIKNTKK